MTAVYSKQAADAQFVGIPEADRVDGHAVVWNEGEGLFGMAPLGSGGGTATVDAGAIAAAVGDELLAMDTFARDDGALGVADSGATWSVLGGTVTVASNKASGTTGAAGFNTGDNDVDITVSFAPFASSTSRVVLRAADADDYIYLDLTTTGLRLRKLTAGVVANITSTFGGTITAGTDIVVRVVANGDQVKVYRGSTLVNTVTLSAGDVSGFTGTTHGFYISSTARVNFITIRSIPVYATTTRVDGIEQALRAPLFRDLHAYRYAANLYHSTTSTLAIEDYGYTYPSGTRFRGAIVAPTGDVLVISRDSGFFVIIHPDGTAEQTDLGLTSEQLVAINLSGGTVGPDGLIYSAPRDSDQVAIIDPTTWTCTLTDFGLDLDRSGAVDKWTGAVLAPNGKIYCPPTSSRVVLVIDPFTGTAELTDLGQTWATGSKNWVGGCLAPNGKIFVPAFNADHVAIIDPFDDSVRFEDFGLDMSANSKWSGAVIGADGYVYMCPRQADAILRINPWTETAEEVTWGASWTGGLNNWTRFVPGPDGKLYGSPADETRLMVVDPIAQSVTLTNLGTTISSAVEKYIGGVLAPNGKIYMTPDKASDFLIITPHASVPALPVDVVMSPMLNKSP